MANQTPRSRTTPKLVLYDLHQVAHFLHEVAYALAAASNTKIVHQWLILGGDQLSMSDMHVIRQQADQIASTLMSQFSMLCKAGSESAVDGFLKHQQQRYLAARRNMNATFAQFYKSNAATQRTLGTAADIAHIVHGAADATFTVLSFFVSGGGGGMAAATGLNMIDSAISSGSVIGVVKDEARDEMLDSVGEAYTKKASRTLTNIVSRDWKYAGALKNAQVRVVTQTGVAVGARTLSIYFAVEEIKENFAEIGDAWEDLANQSPAGNYEVNSVPGLQMPQQL